MLGTSQRRMRGVVSTRVLYPNQPQNTIRADSCVLSRLTGLAKMFRKSFFFDPSLDAGMASMPCLEVCLH
jgi:hypothetical protein